MNNPGLGKQGSVRDRHAEFAADRDAPDSLRFWLAYVEQSMRVRTLSEELAAIHASRSWRLTAPLRRWLAWMRPSKADGIALRPADTDGTVAVAEPSIAIAELPRPLREWLERMRSTAAPGERLLVDVTEVDLEDLGAGIQRVTKHVLAELLRAPPQDKTVVPVRLAAEGRYCVASRFCERFLGLPAGSMGAESKVEPALGDVFLGLDFTRRHADQLAPALGALKASGTRILMLVYDLLPLTRPQWFPARVSAEFEAWLPVMARHADVALCISDSTRTELTLALARLGVDFPGQAVTVALGSDALKPYASGRQYGQSDPIRVLVVGTLEPRKGHAEVLDAFDRLWERGLRIELNFAGRTGWHVDSLDKRIRRHPQYGRLLRWYEAPDDTELASLYASVDLLLMASMGEGFGLPIAEAGFAGCRLLLRDLPVFREVAGQRARYFGGGNESLADALASFAQSPQDWPDPLSKPWPRWRESAAAIARWCSVGEDGAEPVMRAPFDADSVDSPDQPAIHGSRSP